LDNISLGLNAACTVYQNACSNIMVIKTLSCNHYCLGVFSLTRPCILTFETVSTFSRTCLIQVFSVHTCQCLHQGSATYGLWAGSDPPNSAIVSCLLPYQLWFQRFQYISYL